MTKLCFSNFSKKDFKDHIARKIKATDKYMTEAQFHTVFLNIEELLLAGMDSLLVLEQRIESWPSVKRIGSCVSSVWCFPDHVFQGDILLKFVNYLPLFFEYCKNSRESLICLTELHKKDKVPHFFRKSSFDLLFLL